MTEPKVTTSVAIPVSLWIYARKRGIKLGPVTEAGIRALQAKDKGFVAPAPVLDADEEAAFAAELARMDADLPPDAPHGKEERLRYGEWLARYQRQFGPGQRPPVKELWAAWRAEERLAAENVPGGASA